MPIYNIKPLLDSGIGEEGSSPSYQFSKVEGKLYLVKSLPEKGDVANLYKLFDGSVWSWYHKETKIIDPVELNKGYDLIYNNISKDKLKEFLEEIRREVLYLYGMGIQMTPEDFGKYEIFTQGLSGMYKFPIPMSVFIEDKLYTLNATCYLCYNVVDGEITDSESMSVKNNATINIKIEDFEDNDTLFNFYYNFMNPLSPLYIDVEDQRWLLVDNDTVIVSKEQLDVLEFKLLQTWADHLEEAYNYKLDYSTLTFVLDGGSHIDVDEGYTPVGEGINTGTSIDFDSSTGKLSLLNEKEEVISYVNLGISTAIVSAVYDTHNNMLTLTDMQGNKLIIPIKSSGGSETFTVDSLDELTPEFVIDNVQGILNSMFLEDNSTRSIYTKNSKPGPVLPFRFPTMFSNDIVFTQPNILTGKFNYISIDVITGEVIIREGE